MERWFPLHPDLDRLQGEARALLRDLGAGEPDAVTDWQRHHPDPLGAAGAQLADAQLVLARSYGFPSWALMEQSCRMTTAIWADDLETVRALAADHPDLVRHHAHRNWGPPMSFAANLGRDRIVEMLHAFGAEDVQWAFERACLQGRLRTARRLHAMGGRAVRGSVMGPCETLNADGLELLLELGAELTDGDGDPLAPVGLVLETYCRNPEGKHRCLERLSAQGIALPATPTMAVHRGRLDLLAEHLRRDPHVVTRTFGHDEIYPRALGCHEDESLALCGTPLVGGTLLHLCVDFDEVEIAEWLLAHGADPNTPATVDAEGFGGHTALFGCVVSQPYRTGRQRDAALTRMLLDAGADPNTRASLRKRLWGHADESLHEYRDVRPLSWGERFHGREWVNPLAMDAIAAAGGRAG